MSHINKSEEIHAPAEEAHDESTPDWLKNNESPFGSEDVLSKEVNTSATEEHTPEWMHDHHEQETKTVQSETIHQEENSS